MPKDYDEFENVASREPMRRTTKIRKPPEVQDQKFDRQRKRIAKTYEDMVAAQRENYEKMRNKPANYCVLCGYPMNYNGHQPTEWELIWSTHEPCREAAFRMLDRESGVARERRQFGDRNRHR